MSKGLCSTCDFKNNCEDLKNLRGIPDIYITQCEDYNGVGGHILSREEEKKRAEREYTKLKYGSGGPGGF